MKNAMLIEAQNLSLEKQRHLILENVSFRLEPGEYAGLVGPNGAGKTTLIRLLLGLEKPSAGSLRVQGYAAGSREANRSIGYVPQHLSSATFNLPMTACEVVATGLARLRRWGPLRKEERLLCLRSLEQVGSARLASQDFQSLSGGEKQRVILARALASQPQLLLLDEPMSAIDSPSQKDFLELLHRLNRKEGLGILMVSHDLEMISRQVSKVLCLNRTLRAACHPDELTQGDLSATFGEHISHIHHHDHA